MPDLPTTITLDLSDKPGLAAMLQALLVVQHERCAEARVDLEGMQEYRAHFEGIDPCNPPAMHAKMRELAERGIRPPRPHGEIPERLNLAELALELLEAGVGMRLQHVGQQFVSGREGHPYPGLYGHMVPTPIIG